METLAFPLLVTMQRNNIGVVSVSMELLRLRLPSNDGLKSNTSQYIKPNEGLGRTNCLHSLHGILVLTIREGEGYEVCR
jgi:hypothetical protein